MINLRVLRWACIRGQHEWSDVPEVYPLRKGGETALFFTTGTFNSPNKPGAAVSERGERSSADQSQDAIAGRYRPARDFQDSLSGARSSSDDELAIVALKQSRARIGTDAWRRLEDARDPAAASAARDMDDIRNDHRTQTQAARANRSVENGRAVRQGRIYSCVVCGTQWCQYAGARQSQTCSAECWRVWQSAQSVRETPSNTERDHQIANEHAAGQSFQALAKHYDLTPERIGQIVRQHCRP